MLETPGEDDLRQILLYVTAERLAGAEQAMMNGAGIYIPMHPMPRHDGTPTSTVFAGYLKGDDLSPAQVDGANRTRLGDDQRFPGIDVHLTMSVDEFLESSRTSTDEALE